MGIKCFILKELFEYKIFSRIHLKWPEARGKGGVNGPPYTSYSVNL